MTDVADGQIGALVTSIFPEVGEPWFGTESNRIRYERVATSVILFSNLATRLVSHYASETEKVAFLSIRPGKSR